VGHFCLTGSGSGFRIRIRIPNPDPDPLTRLNSDPIRIRIRNPGVYNTSTWDPRHKSQCIPCLSVCIGHLVLECVLCEVHRTHGLLLCPGGGQHQAEHHHQTYHSFHHSLQMFYFNETTYRIISKLFIYVTDSYSDPDIDLEF
jgi:hypothetical protein